MEKIQFSCREVPIKSKIHPLFRKETYKIILKIHLLFLERRESLEQITSTNLQ